MRRFPGRIRHGRHPDMQLWFLPSALINWKHLVSYRLLSRRRIGVGLTAPDRRIPVVGRPPVFGPERQVFRTRRKYRRTSACPAKKVPRAEGESAAVAIATPPCSWTLRSTYAIRLLLRSLSIPFARPGRTSQLTGFIPQRFEQILTQRI